MVATGILLENEAGKLLISKDTIENLVNGVAKGFQNTQSVTTKINVNSDNELKVFVTLMVLPNTVINELSMNLQTRIKEVVKNVADLEVKAIDIKIKNITTPEEKTDA
ncbi:MAG: Asp23/Gls24 family envelope stress response protein [Clostridia bacterium]|nr:Asp23/Gls24 family envelope stress response protein [Clostridia bacterium]